MCNGIAIAGVSTGTRDSSDLRKTSDRCWGGLIIGLNRVIVTDV